MSRRVTSWNVQGDRDVDWIHLAQTLVQWPAFVERVLKLRVAKTKHGEFIEYVSDCQLLKKYSDPWNYFQLFSVDSSIKMS